MIGTSITKPDTLGFFIDLARVTEPRVTTNGLKASLGIADLVRKMAWAETAFLPSEDVVRATDMAYETVLKSIDQMRIVQRVAGGRHATPWRSGQAAEWILNLASFRWDGTSWPTNYLSPAHPQWGRRSEDFGANGWRLALALCDRFGLEPGRFSPNDVELDTGMKPRTQSGPSSVAKATSFGQP